MWEDASLTCDQSDGAGGNTLFATGESEMFGGGGFDGDVLFGNLHDSGERALHFGNIGTDFRTLCNDGGIDVADFITGFAHQLHGSRQQNLTVDVLELLTVIGKIKTDVAQSGSSEHGVADGMDQYVGITVAQQSQRMFNPMPPNQSGRSGTRRWTSYPKPVRIFMTMNYLRRLLMPSISKEREKRKV